MQPVFHIVERIGGFVFAHARQRAKEWADGRRCDASAAVLEFRDERPATTMRLAAQIRTLELEMTMSNDLVPPSERTYEIEHVAIGTDVRVSLTTLVGDQTVPWHRHSSISDIFFCLEGMVLVQVRGQNEGVELAVGDRYEVEAGTEHRVRSADGRPCRFLLVQGVGEADFVRSEPT